MKFWKSLSNLIEETLPDWRDKFLSYKDLKQQLKLIYPKEGESVRANKRPRLSDDTDGPWWPHGFHRELYDKEEEYIIRLKVLQDRVAEAQNSNEELMKVGREMVDFHGEMVLLENYSALNYTGLVKILKKYDKRSGALIRLPFIQKVLRQPFFTTDVLNKLVKESETMLDQLFSTNERSAPAEAAEERCDTNSALENKERLLKIPEELAEIENMESSMHMKTVSALRVLKEIRSGSSTRNLFSLPPLQSNELEEVWKKVPVLEQTAK
ncbi:hypothetical protein F0562_007314 [Nyssa sinensis]|uniref:SPX domain-containing protein n=1 Tax=Nyssa sinensis TaxID=561372 RepID=A0A5J5A505_9ASTE|nr:hypothetical protein F0562_007314 [Nyssa sinensis]